MTTIRMYDVILAKRNHKQLTKQQIEYLVTGITRNEIPDYQISALLMAIYFNGMEDAEIAFLTKCMAESGECIDLSPIKGIKVDKHSTGGVGDKTTLICAPIVAACGVPVAKMSGRGLGHTGGTVDKLAAIPGYRTALSQNEFFRIVNDVGLSVIGQTGNIAPADKILYALRDVTATVDSIPLIASSIMSKKLASGADAILLDVKVGSGALIKDLEQSLALAQKMVAIGVRNGRKLSALISDMDIPLGTAIGNSLEVREAVETLQNNGPKDLTQLCLTLAADMLFLANAGSLEQCYQMAKKALGSGEAFEVFRASVQAHGGDVRVLDDPECFEKASIQYAVKARTGGVIVRMNTEAIGTTSVILGAGRATKEDEIDYAAGIELLKKTGDRVEAGETIAVLHTAKESVLCEVERQYLQACQIAQQSVPLGKTVLARVTSDGLELF